MALFRSLTARYGLKTATKSVVDASGILVDVGDIGNLDTSDKSGIVAAVNELKGYFDNIDTSQVAEDPGYLYFTTARARESISVTDSGGDGSLSYSDSTGVITYTGPSASEVRAHFSGGTGVTITDGVVAIGQPVSTTSSVTFNNTTLTGVLYGPSQFVIDPAAQGDNTGELIILGDLIVQGTTTTINSTTLEVEDKTIVVSKSATTSAEADNSGLIVAGSGSSLLYKVSTDSWNINKVLKGVYGDQSSPAFSFSDDAGLGLYRSADNQLSIATNSNERVRVSDTLVTLVPNLDLAFDQGTYAGTITAATLTGNRTYTLPDVSGTLVTSGDTGTVTSAMIENGTIVDEDISESAEIVDTKLATIATAGKVSNSATTATSANTVDTIVARDGSGNFTAGTITAALTGNADTATKLSSTRTFAVTGDITGTVNSDLTSGASIATSIAAGVIVDGDINASAGIAFSKLAPLTSANILVGSGGNVATSVAVTGDINISNTGVTSISSGVIVDADVSATAEIAVSKLSDGSARQLLQTDAAGTGVEWTDNIDVPGTLDVTGVATFDNKISVGAAEPTAEAEVGWNADKGTLDVGLLNGVISPYGQDIITLCRNNTASTIAKGTAVMFTGTIGNSGRLTISPMVSDGTYPGYVFFGVASQSIAAGADGYIRSFGEIKGVDTDIDEGGVDGQWAEGDILWCDPATPGGFTKVEPLAPNLKLPVAAVVSVGNNGILFVRWDSGRRLQDLHDVESNGSTTDNELLQYNASASRWEHVTDVTLPGRLVLNSIDITDSARDIEESRLIRKNATVSIGLAGTVPFGIGPVIPPGMSLIGIGPDAYNVIDIYSGSVC